MGQGLKWNAPSSSLLRLAVGDSTLCLAEGSNTYLLLIICNPFLWTLNRDWPLNSTTSQLGNNHSVKWPLHFTTNIKKLTI